MLTFCSRVRLFASATSSPSFKKPRLGPNLVFFSHCTLSPKNGAKCGSNDNVYIMFCLQFSNEFTVSILKDNNVKVKQINQKLSQVDASAGKLEQLTRELKRAEHDLKSTEGTVDIPKLKQEIDQLAKDKLELDAKISQLSSEMNRLHLQSSAQAQIDVLKKDKGSKEENIREIEPLSNLHMKMFLCRKAKQEDTISYLLGHMPTTNIRTQIDDYIGPSAVILVSNNPGVSTTVNTFPFYLIFPIVVSDVTEFDDYFEENHLRPKIVFTVALFPVPVLPTSEIRIS
ncbi:RAD50 [Mytilus edulis]|uniref:RAD50 n=1 Tax=Mytilus edulis TaxID=6550 RepID=A0A8S3TDK8_MYTED|nr:RAD50 [Mytilus edulis]